MKCHYYTVTPLHFIGLRNKSPINLINNTHSTFLYSSVRQYTINRAAGTICMAAVGVVGRMQTFRNRIEFQ